MGTEIFGLIIFIIMAFTFVIAWSFFARNIFVSVVGCAGSLLIISHVLNYYSVGEFQIFTLEQYFYVGVVPGVLNSIIYWVRGRSNVASSAP